MSDNIHPPEYSQSSPTASSDVHVTGDSHESVHVPGTTVEATGTAEVRDTTATASEPPFESQEAPQPAAYAVDSSTTPTFVPTGDLLSGEDTHNLDIQQSADAPHLPPRPSTEHQPDPQSMSANVIPTGNAQPEEHTDPAIPVLKSMFPDFDDAVLQSVLESVNGSQDAAVDVLLGMSDPTYVSTQHTAVPAANEANPSLDLDEQLARQLMLEDQRQQQEQQNRWRPSGQNWPRRSSGDVPYQTRQGHPGQPGEQQEGGQGGERVQELKETFNQIAESGKRTFSSIVSKVKAKINEYEQTRPNQQQQQQQPQPPSWGSSSSSQPSNINTAQQPGSYPSHYSTDPYPAPAPAPKNSAPVDRHMTSQAYAQYYTVGSDEEDGWTPVGHKDKGQPRQSADGGAQEVKGYDVDADDADITISYGNNPPAGGSAAGPPASTSPPVSSSPPADVPRPPTTVAGNPINAAKLGLLPRRPVNLMSSQPASPPPRQAGEDDEDELDYVENPFEDARK